MARGKYKLIRANGLIIYETRVIKGGRFTFPEPMRGLLTPGEPIRITIERITKQDEKENEH